MTAPLDSGVQSGASQETEVQSGPEGTTETPDPNAQSGAETGTQPSPEQVAAEKYRQRMIAADQKASKYEAELKQLRDKDLPEMDRMRRDIEEKDKALAEAQEGLRRARIDNAFLKANKYRWRDNELALKNVDLSDVDIDDQGNVIGIEKALERMAKAYPWMLEEKDKEEGSTSVGTASTPPMTGKASTDKPDRAKMVKRFSAMGSRVRPTS